MWRENGKNRGPLYFCILKMKGLGFYKKPVVSMNVRYVAFSLLLLWAFFPVFAQSPNLSVQLLTGTHIDTVLNLYLAGEGVQLSNGRFNNHQGNINSNQIGVFHRNGFTQFPFESGLVMCTGKATVAQGPNNSISAGITVTGSYVEPLLTPMVSEDLYDCASLDFDFMTNSDTFVFRYIFASEEYCEYVNSQYNDIFAFFLTGPDPVTHVNTTKNVAIIPGSVSAANPNGIPVSINNVNHGYHEDGLGPGSQPSYSQYFVHNSATNGIQFDGYTAALEAGSPVQACTNYHMKLTIGDVGDENYDSGVFLEENSFESVPDPSLSLSGFYCLHDDIVFNFTAQNVDSVHLITPSGDTLREQPFVIHDALVSDTGYYYLWSKKAVGCNGNPWVSDSVFVSVRIPCVSAICDGPKVCAGDVVSFSYSHDTIEGPWVGYVGTSQFTLNPPATLPHDTVISYRFNMYDDYGCHFDTTVNVQYMALKHSFVDTSACENFLWGDTLCQTTGTYNRTFTSVGGCDSLVTLYLAIHHHEAVADTLVLVENQLPYYFASADVTVSSDAPAFQQFVYTLPTQYQCDSVITQTVLVYYNVEQTFDTAVCESDLPLEWRGHLYAEEGTFTDTLLTVWGSDSVNVYQLFVNRKFDIVLNDVICEGDGYTAQGFVIPEVETVGVDSLERTLFLQSADGCDSVVQLHLDVMDTALSIVSFTEDFCENMSAELMVVTGFEDYVWNTGEHSPNITVTVSGVYSVTASGNSCRATAHILVEGCDLQLVLPNAITPSKGDGLNDGFGIPEILQPFLYDFEIRIFNRWGEQVFHSTDKSFRWNGEVKGKLFVGTTYNYIIRYKNFSGKPYVLKGGVTVL